MVGRGRGMELTRPAWMTAGSHTAAATAAAPPPRPNPRPTPSSAERGQNLHDHHQPQPPPPPAIRTTPARSPGPQPRWYRTPPSSKAAARPANQPPLVPRSKPLPPQALMPAPARAAAASALPPARRPPSPVRDEWVPTLDADGRQYWYSVLTRETTWDPPPVGNRRSRPGNHHQKASIHPDPRDPIEQYPGFDGSAPLASTPDLYALDDREHMRQEMHQNHPYAPRDRAAGETPHTPSRLSHTNTLSYSPSNEYPRTASSPHRPLLPSSALPNVPRHMDPSQAVDDNWYPRRSPSPSHQLESPRYRGPAPPREPPSPSMSPVHWITPSPTAQSPAPTTNTFMTQATGSDDRTLADMPRSPDSRRGAAGANFRLAAVANRVGKKAKKRRGKATTKRPNHSEAVPVRSKGLTSSQTLDQKEAELDAWDAAQKLAKQVLAQDAEIQALRRQVAELRRASASVSQEIPAGSRRQPAASDIFLRGEQQHAVRDDDPAI